MKKNTFFLEHKKKIIIIMLIVVAVLFLVMIAMSAFNGITNRSLTRISNYKYDFWQPELMSVEAGFIVPEFKGKATMTGKEWLNELEQLLKESEAVAGTIEFREAFFQVAINYDSEEKNKLLLTRDLKVFDPVKEAWLNNKALSKHLAELTVELEDEFFGKLVSWSEVNHLFPRKTKAVVRDLETGLSFQVYRYGGSNHVDVEPVTLADTNILRFIYGGDWNWKRRAVVVTVGNRQIAASMNGMPHGNGDIRDNQFKEHFCIHFGDSRVHKTGRVDPGHQLMVKKAGGIIWDTLKTATPTEFVTLLLATIANGDRVNMRYIIGEQHLPELWSQLATEIRYMQISDIRELGVTDDKAQVEVDLIIYFYEPNKDMGYKKSFILNLAKPEPLLGWVANLDELGSLIEKIPTEIDNSVETINAGELAGCY